MLNYPLVNNVMIDVIRFLNKIQKSLILIVILIFIQGCETTITAKYTSNPSGAQIYSGETPTQLFYKGITPHTESFTGVGPYWKEWYFQFRKDGYYDSEIIHGKKREINQGREVWANLSKVKRGDIVKDYETTIYVKHTTNPSGAEIYGGKTSYKLTYMGTTPNTNSFSGVNPYWEEWYYQFRKDGYYDSEILHFKDGSMNVDREVSATLRKVKPTSPPSQSQPEKNESTVGTAFSINLQGNIISNYHVVNDCKIIEVSNTLFKSKANLLFFDNINDLAVLKVEEVPSLSIGYFRIGKALRVGDDIITIGYPFGSLLGESPKVTKGNVSSLTGIANDSSMVQISAPIQPGNSGGPLLDNSGNIVGIVSSKLSELAILEATGTLPQNVNFAIKSQTAQLFLDTHNINYSIQSSDKNFETADIVEKAQKFTLQVHCLN